MLTLVTATIYNGPHKTKSKVCFIHKMTPKVGVIHKMKPGIERTHPSITEGSKCDAPSCHFRVRNLPPLPSGKNLMVHQVQDFVTALNGRGLLPSIA